MTLIKTLLASLIIATTLPAAAEDNAPATAMTVYRSPTCGCCGKWIEHVKQHQFIVKDVISDDMDAIKKQHGVPSELSSCHTAIVDGYVIEGHVPAADIRKLLQTKPNVIGLAAPGMPMGSPGMEMGGRKDDYQVVSFDKNGHYAVFADHPAAEKP